MICVPWWNLFDISFITLQGQLFAWVKALSNDLRTELKENSKIPLKTDGKDALKLEVNIFLSSRVLSASAVGFDESIRHILDPRNSISNTP